MKREGYEYDGGGLREYNLLPCPFCGMDVADFTYCHEVALCRKADCDEHFFVAVVCEKMDGGCGAMSAFCDDKEKATSAWNKRNEETMDLLCAIAKRVSMGGDRNA